MYEIFLSGVLGAVLAQEFKLGHTATSLVLASAFVGMFIGVLVIGRLADRLGRRPALLITIGTYAVFSLVGAVSVNAPMLVAARFFAGIGIGPELPLADAYLSDLMPARSRGRYTSWAYTIAFMGVPAVELLGHWVVPTNPAGLAGWRWLFLISAVGGFAVLLLRHCLLESPRWLASVGREAEAVLRSLEAEAYPSREPARNPVHAPIHERPTPPSATNKNATQTQTPEPLSTPASTPTSNSAPARKHTTKSLFTSSYRRRTAMMAIFHVLQSIGFYGFGTMAPLALAAKGYSVVNSLLFSALTFFGYPLGSLISIPLIERLQRKHLIVGSALVMAAAGAVFGESDSTTQIIVAGVCYGTHQLVPGRTHRQEP